MKQIRERVPAPIAEPTMWGWGRGKGIWKETPARGGDQQSLPSLTQVHIEKWCGGRVQEGYWTRSRWRLKLGFMPSPYDLWGYSASRQVLTFLSGIAFTGATPTQAPDTYSAASIAPRMDEASGIDVFFHSILGD